MDSIHFDTQASVTFRKCRFSCAGTGCVVGGYEQSTSVVFENCQFEGSVRVHTNGHITLVYCDMRKLKDGVCVAPGGSAVRIHCTIYEVTGAAATLHLRGEHLEMINCTVQHAPTGLRVAESYELVMRGCLITGVSCILLSSVRTAVIDECTIENCTSGLLIEAGNNALTISNCRYSSVQKKDIFVKDMAAGSLNIVKCKLSKRFRAALGYEAGSIWTKSQFNALHTSPSSHWCLWLQGMCYNSEAYCTYYE